MSNKNLVFSLSFLWHKIPFNQKMKAVIIFILAITLSFGLGFISASRNDRAPIIIEQCPWSFKVTRGDVIPAPSLSFPRPFLSFPHLPCHSLSLFRHSRESGNPWPPPIDSGSPLVGGDDKKEMGGDDREEMSFPHLPCYSHTLPVIPFLFSVIPAKAGIHVFSVCLATPDLA